MGSAEAEEALEGKAERDAFCSKKAALFLGAVDGWQGGPGGLGLDWMVLHVFSNLLMTLILSGDSCFEKTLICTIHLCRGQWEHRAGRAQGQGAAFLTRLYTEICTLPVFHIFLFPCKGKKLIKAIQEDKINQ